MAHQVVADIVGAAEADGFRRWALLRFGHAEAAFKALEAKTQDDGQLEASGLLDIARLEEAARGCGYPGPPGSVAGPRGFARLLFDGIDDDGRGALDANAFVAAIEEKAPSGTASVASLPDLRRGGSASLAAEGMRPQLSVDWKLHLDEKPRIPGEERVRAEVERKTAAELDATAESESAALLRLRTKLELVRGTEARLQADLFGVVQDAQKLFDRIAIEMQEARGSSAMDAEEEGVTGSQDEGRFVEVELSEVEAAAANVVADALEVVSGASGTFHARVDGTSGLAGLQDAHEAIRRCWTRRREVEAALHNEVRIARATVGEFETRQFLKRSMAFGVSSNRCIRAELDEVRKASAEIWDLAAGVTGEASENDELRRQHAGIKEEQERALSQLLSDCEEMQVELDEAGVLARRAHSMGNEKFASLQAEALDLTLVHGSVQAELAQHQRDEHAQVEERCALERTLRRELQEERQHALQELLTLRGHAELFMREHREAMREVDIEKKLLDSHTEAFVTSEMRLEAACHHHESGAKVRLHELHFGFGQLEQAHGISQKEVFACRERWHMEATEHAITEQNLRSELANWAATLGGRPVAFVQHLLAEEEEELARATHIEQVQEQRTASLRAELQSGKELEYVHDAACRGHVGAQSNTHAQTEQEIQAHLRQYQMDTAAALRAMEESRRHIQLAEIDASRAFRNEVADARRVEADAAAALTRELRDELDVAMKEESETVAATAAEMHGTQCAVEQATATWRALASSLKAEGVTEASWALGATAAVPAASPPTATAVLAPDPAAVVAQEVATALWRARARTTEEAAMPLGKLFRKKIRLTAEAAALETHSADLHAQQLEQVEKENQRVETHLRTEMAAAAARVEILRQSLRAEVAVLQGDGADRLRRERAALASEVQELRETVRVRNFRLGALRGSEARRAAEEAEVRHAERETERSLKEVEDRLVSVGELHAEEMNRARRLSGVVAEQSEVHVPAQEQELNAILNEGRSAEARIRMEIVAERRAALNAKAWLEAGGHELARAENQADGVAGQAISIMAHATELEVNASQSEAYHAVLMAEAKQAMQETLDQCYEAQARLRQTVERRRLELQNLEQLGFRLESEVERRLIQRTAACNDELGSFEAHRIMEGEASALKLEQLQRRGAALEAALADLREAAPRVAGELSEARAEWRRWCGDAGLPRHVVAAEELEASISEVHAAAAWEVAEMRQRRAHAALEAEQSAEEAELRKIGAWEVEALRVVSEAHTAAGVSHASATSRARGALAQARGLGEALHANRLELNRQEAACLAMEFQIRASRSSAMAIERRAAERAAQHRQYAQSELRELREVLAQLHGDAQRLDDSAKRACCNICGGSHAPSACDVGALRPASLGAHALGAGAVVAATSLPAKSTKGLLSEDALLGRLAAVTRNEARMRMAAAMACESVREAFAPARLAQLEADRQDVVDLRKAFEEFRRRCADTEAVIASLEASSRAKNAATEAALEDARALEATAASATKALFEECRKAAAQRPKQLLDVREREAELAVELAEMRESLKMTEGELEEVPRAAERKLSRVRTRRESAAAGAALVEERVLERLQLLHADLSSATDVASASRPSAAGHSTFSDHCGLLGAAWRALLCGTKADANAKIAALAAVESAARDRILQEEGGHDAAREEIAELELEASLRRQDAETAHGRDLAQHERVHFEAEEELEAELADARGQLGREEDALRRQRATWTQELRAAAERADSQRAARAKAWRDELKVLEGLCVSWRQGAAKAREDLRDAEAREAVLRKNTSMAQARMNGLGATLREEARAETKRADQRWRQKAQQLRERLDEARAALAQREDASAAFAADELDAQRAADRRQAALVAELGAMQATVPELQRKHQAAIQAVREVQSSFSPNLGVFHSAA